MAKIAAKPVLFKAPVRIGDDEYTAHLSQVECVPTRTTSTWTDLDGTVYPFTGSSSWVLNLAGAQDYETVDGLSMFLLEHEGEEITVEWDFGGHTWSTKITAGPVTIGGTINTPAAFSTSYPASKPTHTPLVTP